MCCFFFSSRRRHTRWNCDWSSDVCSSDLVGRDEAARRVLPTHERLVAGDRPRCECDRRLVVEDELVEVECAAEIGLELETLDEARVHLRVVDRVAAPAA